MNAMPNPAKLTRSVGFWMASLMVLLQLVNAARAFSDPVGFATYLGLPLADSADTGFVAVFGLRALFLAVFAATLLLMRQIRVLSLMALVAVIMPIGDVLLVSNADAPTATIVRHAVIGLYLLVTWFFLRRWSEAATNTNASDVARA